MIQAISVAEYAALAEEIDCGETIYLASRWPILTGWHPDLGRIALLHVGDVAAIVTAPPDNFVGADRAAD